jgi:hypothetical protein
MGEIISLEFSGKAASGQPSGINSNPSTANRKKVVSDQPEKFRVSGCLLRGKQPSAKKRSAVSQKVATWNSEPGTWNSEPRTQNF